MFANGYRLPSSEEWEFAYRGGEYYTYAGSDTLEEVDWYYSNSNEMTHEVGLKKSNGYGLYDMSGNVKEWVGTVIRLTQHGEQRLTGLKGGCYLSGGMMWVADTVVKDCQATGQENHNPNSQSSLYGFRIVCREDTFNDFFSSEEYKKWLLQRLTP